MTDEEFEKLDNCEKLRYRICKLDLSEYTLDKLIFSLTDIKEELDKQKEVLDKIKEYIENELYSVGGCVHGSDLPYEAIEPLKELLEEIE